MKEKTEDWENELWSFIDKGDGVNCPLYPSCQHQENSDDCLSRDKLYADEIHEFIDRDFLILPSLYGKFPKMPGCNSTNTIFRLVRKLARNYTDKIGSAEIPVPTEIINQVCNDQHIEVRLVNLKSTHGAVWQLKDDWVIHLNSQDSSARRRFTLYHEIFHILAHCNATPVFKKTPSKKVGSFNELIADYFAAVMIMPESQLITKWAETKDIRELAAIFDVPEPIMYCRIKLCKLV
jgi:Zn-dependent peptidase ImmA (M78 family)